MLLTLSLTTWAFTPNVAALLVVLAPMALSAGVINVTLTSQLTKAVYEDEVGGTLGLASALQTLSRIVSPGLGGAMLDFVGTWTVGVVGGLIMLWTFSVIRRRILTISETEMVSCRGETASKPAN